MIEQLENWYKEGFRIGDCLMCSSTFCSYLNWYNIGLISITGHICCYTKDYLVDPTNGCVWEDVYRSDGSNSTIKTVISALSGKKPTFKASYFKENLYRLDWDYAYKKKNRWNGKEYWDIDIELQFSTVQPSSPSVTIGKFSTFMR